MVMLRKRRLHDGCRTPKQAENGAFQSAIAAVNVAPHFISFCRCDVESKRGRIRLAFFANCLDSLGELQLLSGNQKRFWGVRPWHVDIKLEQSFDRVIA